MLFYACGGWLLELIIAAACHQLMETTNKC
jgi:hypothetical protein